MKIKLPGFFFSAVMLALVLALTSCHPDAAPEQNTDTPTAIVTDDAVTEGGTQKTEALTQAPESEPETAAPVLDGSFSTPNYEVTAVDGAYYLNFTNGNEAETGGELAFGEVIYPHFSSLAEMKHRLMNNQLTAKEMNDMKLLFKKTEHGIEICDVSNLKTAVLPEGWSPTRVALYGAWYDISTISDYGRGTVSLSGQSLWEENYESELAMIQTKSNIVHVTDTYDGLPCESYTFTTNTATLKYVFLTVPGKDGRADTHIQLEYRLDTAYPDQMSVSETVPKLVYVFGEAHGVYYRYLLLYLTEAPTVEWLTSFSLAPYEDSNELPAS